MKRTAGQICVLVAAMLAIGAASTAASAAPVQSVKADVTSGPFRMTINAKRAPGNPVNQATGRFSGRLEIGGVGLSEFSGPVTCLDVRGNQVGLFYPIRSTEPPFVSELPSGVYIYLTVDGAGHAVSAGFLPVPGRKAPSCAPAPTFLPATGSATLTP